MDGDNDDSEGADDDEEDLERWGTTKRDYYGADEMETEQDALDEEAEALKIQQKQLQGMTAADYGSDEEEWRDDAAQKKRAKEKAGAVTEVLPQLQIRSDMSSGEKLKLLKSRYPEFEPLSKDFLDVQEQVKGMEKDVQAATELMQKRQTNGAVLQTPTVLLKHRAATGYLSVLAMYFALLTSTANGSPKDAVALPANILRDHPVMDGLLRSREMWLKVGNLPEDDLDMASSEDEQLDGELHGNESGKAVNVAQPQRKRKRKTRAQKAIDSKKAAAEAERMARMEKAQAGLMDLDALLKADSAPNKARKARNAGNEVSLEGETELTAEELAERAQRRRGLRFYTSQIAQKANKRGTAGRNAGGDEDLPYRERLKDRQARLMAEAEKRGKKQAKAGEELGGESDEEDRRQAKAVRGDADSEDDYYDMVAAKTAKKKSDKQALAEAQKQAALQGGQVIEQEVVGPDGKRTISYAIAKNKGLTPHRKKDVRNPRVKKRRKFEDKKKKLASMKPTYKGGEGRGGYKGELTGIKSGLVRSTKL